jgi:heat shock protein beta
MVKRVFITDDLGEEFMPRWLSFLKVTVDGE